MTLEKPLVYVIATGGSIACIGDSRTDFVEYPHDEKRFAIGEMLARIPEANDIADVRAEQILNIGSNDVRPTHWLQIAKRINRIFRDDPKVSGVAITHGTATLEETAYFLNLTCKSEKPVVVTGAQRPPTAISTDADLNLLDAIRVAAAPGARGKGVLTVLNNEIQAARDVTKTNSFRLETFRSNELGFLGYADSDGRIVFYRTPTKAHTLTSEFDVERVEELPRVDIAFAYAGADGLVIRALAGAGIQGIIAAALGNGGTPVEFKNALREARKQGMPVVIATHTGNGRVIPNRRFVDDGFIVADNLAPKKARILLMLALTRTRDPAEIQRMMDTY